MKKERVTKKIMLNKEIIADLSRENMDSVRGGARPSRIGVSCYTGHCCYSKKECETDEPGGCPVE